MLKRKVIIISVAVIILVLGILCTWSYMKPIDNSSFSGFVKTLRRSGYSVKDVTEQRVKDNPIKLLNNEYLLNVSREELNVIVGNAETIEAILKKRISVLTNPLVDFKCIPRLYNKGYLVVTYIGDDKKLLKTLDEVLGKSLIN